MLSAPSRCAPSRLAAWTSLATLLTMTSMVVAVGALTPGYSHVSQFISELGARGAHLAVPFRLIAFGGAGMLLLAFCLAAFLALPRRRVTTFALLGIAIYAAGYVVAAFFPCDAGCRPAQPSTSQLIHNAAGGLGYLLAPACLFALAREARRWPGAGHLVMAGYAAAAAALLGLLTMSPTSAAVGLSQRAMELAVLGWCALCGQWLARAACRAH